MTRRPRRGRMMGVWSGVSVVVAIALTGPALSGPALTGPALTGPAVDPALMAMSTPAAGQPAAGPSASVDPPPLPPIPLPPLPILGQNIRQRAAQAKQRLDGHRGQVPDLVASWGMDEQTGKLALGVIGNDSQDAYRFLVLAGVDPTAVTIRTGAPRNRPLTDLVGGDAIRTPDFRCSLGVNAKDRSGKVFVLTAGHCTEGTTKWTGPNRASLGQTRATNYPGDDFGSIAVTSSGWKATGKVRNGPTIKGSKEAAVGSKVCRSGSTTGYHCGVIQALNQTVNYTSGNVVMGLTMTNVCAEPGDSGGTFVTPAGQAQGITSGGAGDCKKGGTTFFQPINEALQTYGLTLVTG